MALPGRSICLAQAMKSINLLHVVNKHYNLKAFKEADYLNKVVSSSLHNVIKRLLAGKVDLIVDGKLVILDVANKEFPDEVDKIIPVAPPLESLPLFITLHKSRPNARVIMKDFNQSMWQLSRAGRMQEILEEYHFQ